MIKGFFLLSLLFSDLVSYCQTPSFKNIAIDPAYEFRGLSVVDDSVAWVSGRNGVVGKSTDGGNNWVFSQVKGFEKLDFRSLYAFNSKEAVIANAGSPAQILRTSDGGLNWKIVYTNKDSLAFFDGVDFWNDKEGIIYGDPIKGRMLLLKTADGGETWQELPEESRPLMTEGEASFAASGTGIRCYGTEKVIFATGGKVSRLLISTDKGKNWTAVKAPVKQGESSTGIFSFAFAPDSHGIVNLSYGSIMGGNYLKEDFSDEVAFWLSDDLKTMVIGNMSTTGGYRECVEFINVNLALAVGPGGADLSRNKGNTWIPIENQKGFHVVRKARKGKLLIAAGSKRISIIQ